MKKLEVTCPNCMKKFEYHTSQFRPFCCEKCKLIDLGQWLSESYTVPAKNLTYEEALELEKLTYEKSQDENQE